MKPQDITPQYLPTQPASLPYKGAPRSMHDILMQQVNREDKGVEGFVRDESYRAPEVMKKEVTVNEKSPITRNWGLGNITKFAHSMIA